MSKWERKHIKTDSLLTNSLNIELYLYQTPFRTTSGLISLFWESKYSQETENTTKKQAQTMLLLIF